MTSEGFESSLSELRFNCAILFNGCRDMKKLFLMVFMVTIIVSKADPPEGILPCLAVYNSSTDIIWPDTKHNTCSLSSPGCTNSDGFLQMRCCENGYFTNVSCTRNASIPDPRCLGDMRSTKGRYSLDFCYRIINSTTYPYQCKSRTGLMIETDLGLLSRIGGNDSGIWLPVERYQSSFKFVTRNNFYLETFLGIDPTNYQNCLILFNNSVKAVSCEEKYLGICLDYPYVIYKFHVDELQDLLFLVSDYCNNTIQDNDFCYFYQQKYHLDVVYFSSRRYLSEHYLFIQKSNLRVALQIRHKDPPSSNEYINVFAALSDEDWNIFMNRSFPFTAPYEPTNSGIFIEPKIEVFADIDSFHMSQNNPENIKWTQKDDDMHNIFCFFNASPKNDLEKFEIQATEICLYEFSGKTGSLWCDAFDYDLNISRSNIITVRNENTYVSRILVKFFANDSCSFESEEKLDEMLHTAILNEKGINFNKALHGCDSMNYANVTVYWYLDEPAQEIEDIEAEFKRIKNIIRKLSIRKDDIINSFEIIFIRHTKYCMREFTFTGNFSFTWPTTPRDASSSSQPHCNFINHEAAVRICTGDLMSGARWSDVDSCYPDSNLTSILQEMLVFSDSTERSVLNNLNVLTESSFDMFGTQEMQMIAQILSRLSCKDDIEISSRNLSSLINNLQLIDRNMLKESQKEYNATNLILFHLDKIYVNLKNERNYIGKYHVRIAIDLVKYTKIEGVILQSTGNTHAIKFIEQGTPTESFINISNFEAAILFDNELQRIHKSFNISIIVLSIFFEDYLFNNEASPIDTRIVVKVLLPDQYVHLPITIFLATKHITGDNICACWKYGPQEDQFLEGQWQQALRFAERASSCTFKSSSYCTVFTEKSAEFKPGFISDLNVVLLESFPNCTQEVLNALYPVVSEAIKDEKLKAEIEISRCETDNSNSTIIIYWFFDEPAQEINDIENEFVRIKKIHEKLSENSNISISVEGIRHTNYCLKDVTFVGNLSFIWPTTSNSESSSSQPHCYQNEVLSLTLRECSKMSKLGASWLEVKQCHPKNLTHILNEMMDFNHSNANYILNNLNVLLVNSSSKFGAYDVNLVAQIVSRMSFIRDPVELSLRNVSFLMNNLDLVKKNVLEISQEEYDATDSILNSSDTMYRVIKNEEIIRTDYHFNIPINLTNANLKGVIFHSSENSHGLKFIKTATPLKEIALIDNFEAALFFDHRLKSLLRKTNNTSIVLSVFFTDYLFNNIYQQYKTTTIFKVLIPLYDSYISNSFLMTRSNDKYKHCACWEYGMKGDQKTPTSWVEYDKFEMESFPVCYFKSSSYCGIPTWLPREVNDGYVSNLHVSYVDNDSDLEPPYLSLYNHLRKIFDSFILLRDGLSYEIKSLRLFNSQSNVMEIIVNWAFDQSIYRFPDIESEYKVMKSIIEKLPSAMTTEITNIKIVYFRHKKYCIRDLTTGSGTILEWPTTMLGKTNISFPPCYFFIGSNVEVRLRNCSGNFTVGAYWSKVQFCTQNITQGLNDLIRNFNNSDPNDVLDRLDTMTQNSVNDFHPVDISLLADLLSLIKDVNDKSSLNLTTLSSVISNIQMIDNRVLKYSQAEMNSTDRILSCLDDILLTTNLTEISMSEFFVIKLWNCGNCTGIILEIEGKNYNVTTLEGRFDYNKLLEYENFGAAVIFDDKRDFKEKPPIISIFFKDSLFNDAITEHGISIIFGILMQEYKGSIELIYKKLPYKREGCAFWDYGTENQQNIYGRWKNESHSEAKMSFSTCIFNHTTHFAMLFDDVGETSLLLDIITDIGCFLSVIGLFGILITGLIFERWRKNMGNVILMNFVFTVVIQICLFYFSSFIHEIINNSDSCVIIGALLHYSVISEFCWMFIIAVLQFKRFVEVLTGPPKYVLFKSFVCGWVLPLVPVVSILLIDPNNYVSGETGLCYPSQLGLYLGVWLPTTIIILINSIIFGYIMCNIFHRKTECVDTMSNEIIFQWRLALLLFFMLGLTWTFALIGEFILTDLFTYLFCATATMQGFVMFLFFIVFNERTRLMYFALFKRLLKGYS